MYPISSASKALSLSSIKYMMFDLFLFPRFREKQSNLECMVSFFLNSLYYIEIICRGIMRASNEKEIER